MFPQRQRSCKSNLDVNSTKYQTKTFLIKICVERSYENQFAYETELSIEQIQRKVETISQ